MQNKDVLYPNNPELQQKYDKEVRSIQDFNSTTHSLKRRAPWLIPFNVSFFYGSMKFMQNYRYLMDRFWPFKRKSTFKNLLFQGTIQGFLIAGFYITSSFAIVGFNPFTLRKMYGSMNEQNSVANQVFLLAMFKNMGLKEDTIKMIQRDLAEAAAEQKAQQKVEQSGEKKEEQVAKEEQGGGKK